MVGGSSSVSPSFRSYAPFVHQQQYYLTASECMCACINIVCRCGTPSRHNCWQVGSLSKKQKKKKKPTQFNVPRRRINRLKTRQSYIILLYNATILCIDIYRLRGKTNNAPSAFVFVFNVSEGRDLWILYRYLHCFPQTLKAFTAVITSIRRTTCVYNINHLYIMRCSHYTDLLISRSTKKFERRCKNNKVHFIFNWGHYIIQNLKFKTSSTEFTANKII